MNPLSAVLAATAAAALALPPRPVHAQDATSQPAPAMERIIVSPDGTHFMTAESKQRFVVWGVNYDHDSNESRLIEDYWQDEWPTIEGDFAEIKALNANVVRIHLQLERFMEGPNTPNEASLRRLSELVHLAERTGLRLDLTGLACYLEKRVPDWYTRMGEADRWAVQAGFWTAVAKACGGSPAVFCYDLMNEPILPGADKVETDWLPGEFAGMNFVQYLTLDLAGRTRIEVAAAWVKAMTDAIRAIDDKTMITVGVIPWALTFKGAKPIFYDQTVMGPLDFAAVHFYPNKDEIDAAIEALKVYDVGKPLVIEEMFPLSCPMGQMVEFIDRSKPICEGWVSFYWGQTIEECREKGEMQGAILAAWLEKFRELGATTTERAKGEQPALATPEEAPARK